MVPACRRTGTARLDQPLPVEAGRILVCSAKHPDIATNGISPISIYWFIEGIGSGLLLSRLPRLCIATRDLKRLNARATGEVLEVKGLSNNDNGDVEKTFQVLAELKKQQRVSESPPSRRQRLIHPRAIPPYA